MSALLALLAAASFGVADFLGGIGTRRAPVLSVTLISNATGGLLAVGLLLVAGGEWSASAVAYGAVGGLAGLVGLVLLYHALAAGRFQIVSPLSALTGAAVPVTAGLSLGERPATVAVVGLVLTPPAIWLLASGGASDAVEPTNSPPMTSRLLVQAFLAGAGFGVFFVLLDQSPADSGAIPLVTARIASVVALVVIYVATRTPRPRTEAATPAIGAGLTDMTANALFLWAAREGDLSIVGALTSLYPASTVLLASVVLGERMTLGQRAGLAVGLAAAALLSL